MPGGHHHADVYLGRGEDILRKRSAIERQTLTDRHLRHHAQAAHPGGIPGDAASAPPYDCCLIACSPEGTDRLVGDKILNIDPGASRSERPRVSLRRSANANAASPSGRTRSMAWTRTLRRSCHGNRGRTSTWRPAPILPQRRSLFHRRPRMVATDSWIVATLPRLPSCASCAIAVPAGRTFVCWRRGRQTR